MRGSASERRQYLPDWMFRHSAAASCRCSGSVAPRRSAVRASCCGLGRCRNLQRGEPPGPWRATWSSPPRYPRQHCGTRQRPDIEAGNVTFLRSPKGIAGFPFPWRNVKATGCCARSAEVTLPQKGQGEEYGRGLRRVVKDRLWPQADVATQSRLASDGPTGDHGHRHQYLIVVPTGQQQAYRLAPHLVMWQGNRRQPRSQIGGDLVIVEGYD